MQISFTKPLDNAWARMKLTLFSPFNIGTWFALGFTAWLANLGSSGGGPSGNTFNNLGQNGNNGNSWKDRDYYDFQDAGSSALRDVQDVFADGFWSLLVVGIVVLVLVLAVVAMWLSSRGQFMFLDNLVNKRSEVTRPRAEYTTEGNSLFLWQVGYTIISLVVVGSCVVSGIVSGVFVGLADAPALMAVFMAIIAGMIIFVLVMAAIFIEFFLIHFVVPIMYRDRCSTTQAWSRFLALFQKHPGSFVAYGFAYLLLSIVGGLAFFAAGVMTCCVGLLAMAIPYIGTVITLPLSVLGRFFDLEFLDQFGHPILLPDTPAIETNDI